jgi:outer membrane protein OmpA-like peptidoglycan-associated protein
MMTRKVKKIVTIQRDYRRVAILCCLMLLGGFTVFFRSNRSESLGKMTPQKNSAETVVPVTAKLPMAESTSSMPSPWLSIEPQTLYATQPPASSLISASQAASTRKTIVVHFEYNSNTLSEKDKLRILSEILPESDALRITHITIAGHADSEGQEERNQVLSLKRAESVMLALGTSVESKEKLALKAFGSTKAIRNGSDEDKAASRRVEIDIDYALTPLSN